MADKLKIYFLIKNFLCIIFIGFVCLSCVTNNKKTEKQKCNIRKLEIKSAQRNLTADDAIINNLDFEDYFKDLGWQAKTSIVTDSAVLFKFNELLSQQQKSTTGNIDIRTKIIIFYDNKKPDTLWVGYFPPQMKINGSLILFDSDIVKLLEPYCL